MRLVFSLTAICALSACYVPHQGQAIVDPCQDAETSGEAEGAFVPAEPCVGRKRNLDFTPGSYIASQRGLSN